MTKRDLGKFYNADKKETYDEVLKITRALGYSRLGSDKELTYEMAKEAYGNDDQLIIYLFVNPMNGKKMYQVDTLSSFKRQYGFLGEIEVVELED